MKPNTDTFLTKIESLRFEIDDALLNLDIPTEPAYLYTPVKYALKGGGKRLRAILINLVGEIFGECVGDGVGRELGDADGVVDGERVGEPVGDVVGRFEGARLGLPDGDSVGDDVGVSVGPLVGMPVGFISQETKNAHSSSRCLLWNNNLL